MSVRIILVPGLALCLTLLSGGLSSPALEVVNHGATGNIYPEDYRPDGSATKPLVLLGARGCVVAGRAVVADGAAIKGLKVVPGEFKGPRTIPASAVEILYPRGEVIGGGRSQARTAFDALDAAAPAEVPVYKGSGRAVQPLWVRVRVPKDAKPGEYSGELRVSSAGGGAVEVPVRLKVVAWTMPEPERYHAFMDYVQSPESVALAYGAELWSEKHLKLLDRTFALLAEMGGKTVYVTAIPRTHFGNEFAMVRWCQDGEDKAKPDFGAVEKYLDVATRRLGKKSISVIFYCWEPFNSMGHAHVEANDRPVLYTEWDPGSGRQVNVKGPDWGSAESREFWKAFTDGAQGLLAKRGMEGSMLLGLIGDSRPTKQAMDDIANALPKERDRWAVHSHYACEGPWKGHEIGMTLGIWGMPVQLEDPSKGRAHCWRDPFVLGLFPRNVLNQRSDTTRYRFLAEAWMGACSSHSLGRGGWCRAVRGLGRIGADFWPVLKDDRGRLRGCLAGRYPESAWGQMNLAYGIPSVLARGDDGPMPTLRSEALREAVQDAEARVFVDKAITLPAYRGKLGEELARKYREMLDQRIRMLNLAVDGKRGENAPPPADWEAQREALYEAAAAAAGKLGLEFIEEGRAKTRAEYERKNWGL